MSSWIRICFDDSVGNTKVAFVFLMCVSKTNSICKSKIPIADPLDGMNFKLRSKSDLVQSNIMCQLSWLLIIILTQIFEKVSLTGFNLIYHMPLQCTGNKFLMTQLLNDT